MKKIKALLTIFCLITGQAILACDCDNQGEFLTVAPRTKLVSLVKINKYLTFKDIYGTKTPMSMEVEIIDVYKGHETRKTVIVWGDLGHLCRPYLSTFELGKHYVIAFDNGEDPSTGFAHENEKTTDYSISNCGQYWLNVDMKHKMAIGAINKTKNQITLSKLKTIFKAI